jgi:hypothetical protein
MTPRCYAHEGSAVRRGRGVRRTRPRMRRTRWQSAVQNGLDAPRYDVGSGNALGLRVRLGEAAAVDVAVQMKVDEHKSLKITWGREKNGYRALPFSRIDRSAPFTLNAITMYAEWVATEHYRLHVIEEWPEGARKAVALSATRSSLQSLLQNHQPEGLLAACEICLSRGSMTGGMRAVASPATK